MKKLNYQWVEFYYLIRSQWDPVENSEYFPTNPLKNREVIGKWKCERGHFWHETIGNRIQFQVCHMCNSPRIVTEVYNLINLRPDIAKEWHPTKNKGLTPDEVTPRSNKKVWWLCEKNHEWQTTIYNRSKLNGTNCPECCNQQVGQDNNLAILRPDLAAEWDYEENSHLTPYNVTPGSKIKVGWKCEKGHTWKSIIKDRLKGNGCPECSNRKVGNDNKLSILRPDLVREWHPIKNKGLTPDEVTPGSGKKVWWICEKNHEWEATILMRNKRTGCPECSNKRVGKDNNLAILRPDLATEWNYEKNGTLTPFDVVIGSSRKVSWKCCKGHQWIAVISARNRGSGCPECCNKQVGQDNNLAILRPDLTAEWDQEVNGDLTAYDVTPGSSKKVGWKCNNGHKWTAKIANRSRGRNCPFCYLKSR